MTITTDQTSVKAERQGLPLDARRIMGLTTAADLLKGQANLADALSISPRALRYKLAAEHGISDENLSLAAIALDALAERIAGHAQKLRDQMSGGSSRP